MPTLRSGMAAILLFALAAACQNPAGPAATDYSGQWTGTTAQGTRVAFTISSDEAVTTITIEHAFNGCSGSETFSGLNISIVPNVTCIPGPCSPSISSYRSFAYTSSDPGTEPSTALNGVFLSRTTAQGTANFRGFPGCGSATGVAWTATRR